MTFFDYYALFCHFRHIESPIDRRNCWLRQCRDGINSCRLVGEVFLQEIESVFLSGGYPTAHNNAGMNADTDFRVATYYAYSGTVVIDWLPQRIRRTLR